IVTGASSGIGRAFSQALIQKGAIVYGLARRKEKLVALQKKIGNSFRPVTFDITNFETIQQWIDDTFSADHLPSVLVNNAGVGRFGEADQLSPADWHAMLDTNLSGTFYMCRQLIPWMKRNDAVSHIINIASIAGLVGTPT